MLDLKKYIVPELVIQELEATNSNEAIKELIDLIAVVKPDMFDLEFTSNDLYMEMSDHEIVRPSGLGNSLAVPHVRLEKCQEFVFAIGRSKNGIDFGARDDMPCKFVFLMVIPEDQPYLTLQAVGTLSRYFSNVCNVNTLSQTNGGESFTNILINGLSDSSKSLMASDMMRPIDKLVTLDTSIVETSKIMNIYHYDILPVIDQEGNMQGEISCLDIFGYGIPDFFNQLPSVSFVKHLDPFEKYFKYKRNLLVRDIYNKNAPVITADSTLMEIVFLVTARKHSTLYVMEK